MVVQNKTACGPSFGGLAPILSTLMEPISIINGSAHLGNLCVQIYTLIRDAQNVDDKVRRLGEEVNSLSHVLGSIKVSFSDQASANSASTISTGYEIAHWRNVDRSFSNCERTLERFRALLVTIRTGGGQFRRPRMLLRLNMNDREIGTLRHELAAFTQTMQLSLNLISVYLFCCALTEASPFAVKNHSFNYALITQIDSMKADLDNLRSASNRVPSIREYPNSIFSNLEDYVQSTAKVISGAETIIADRSTLYGGSETRSVMGAHLNRDHK